MAKRVLSKVPTSIKSYGLTIKAIDIGFCWWPVPHRAVACLSGHHLPPRPHPGNPHHCQVMMMMMTMVIITLRLVLTLASLYIARLTDLLRGHIKKTSLWLLALATVAYTGLSLVSTGALTPPSYVSLEASVFSLLVIGNCLARSTGPLLQVKLFPTHFRYVTKTHHSRSSSLRYLSLWAK